MSARRPRPRQSSGGKAGDLRTLKRSLGRTLKRYVRGYNNERSIGTSGRDISGTISITEVALDANDNLIATETAFSSAASIVGGASATATRFSAGVKATMVLPS